MLDAEINAPVEQLIVLDATDALANQCFSDTALRDVNENVLGIPADQFGQIPFLHPI